jgi:uncharacterized Zn finger protein
VTEKIRPVVCKKCSTKHEVIEINGAYPILNCKKCGVVLFYDSGKNGIQANSNTTLIFVSEEFFQERKSVLNTNLRVGRKILLLDSD